MTDVDNVGESNNENWWNMPEKKALKFFRIMNRTNQYIIL